jgi:hypothetical protein
MKNLICLLALFFFAYNSKAQEETEVLLKERNFSGVTISGEEYWVFDDDRPGSPYAQNRIIWSYNKAPKTAQKCGEIAYKKLTKWLKDKNSTVYRAMNAYKKAGGVSRIYLWVNDYTIGPNQSARPRRSNYWLWKNTYFKFESTLMPDGTCNTPSEKQVVNYVNKKLVEIGTERIDPEGELSNHSRDSIERSAPQVNNASRRSWWSEIQSYFGDEESLSSPSSASGSSQ